MGSTPQWKWHNTYGGYDIGKVDDLNKASVVNQEQRHYERNKTRASSDGRTQVLFDNLEEHAVNFIQRYNLILGCVAWLTNRQILAALAEKHGVAIVVQKEDFLRPDDYSYRVNDWKLQLRDMYSALSPVPWRFAIQSLARRLNYGRELEIEPVRCVGNYNRDKKPAFPRMHHKFMIGCEMTGGTISEPDDYGWVHEVEPVKVTPRAVWTGSFNFTENATRSLENAVIMHDPEIVSAYLDEYSHVLALSEPVDWEVDWVTPEYRIGT